MGMTEAFSIWVETTVICRQKDGHDTADSDDPGTIQIHEFQEFPNMVPGIVIGTGIVGTGILNWYELEYVGILQYDTNLGIPINNSCSWNWNC